MIHGARRGGDVIVAAFRGLQSVCRADEGGAQRTGWECVSGACVDTEIRMNGGCSLMDVLLEFVRVIEQVCDEAACAFVLCGLEACNGTRIEVL